MLLYRISKPQYVSVALLGQGSAITGGRWNSPGTRIAYTATSVSLAMLEMLVHINKDDVPSGLRILTYDVPDDAVMSLDTDYLPDGWDTLPPYSAFTQGIGDGFVGATLRVPSAVARGEYNVLINPLHPRFAEIKLISDDPLTMDARFFP